jgi:hypothetical protein
MCNQSIATVDHGRFECFAEVRSDRGDTIAVDEDVAGERLVALRTAHGDDRRFADECIHAASPWYSPLVGQRG